MKSPIPTAVLTTGELYEGITTYHGLGSMRWCALCGTHKVPGGGHIKQVFGGKHWVCQLHKKPAKK